MASNVSQIFSIQKGSNQHIILNSHKTEISGNFLVLNDSSFSNVDINGNFKLNGTDVSGKLNNFDSSLSVLNTSLGNFDTSLNQLLTTNKDASFTNVNISGIFKLNGTDISNRLNNFDSSLSVLNTSLGNFDTTLNDLLTTNKDASFNNVDISGIFKLNGTDISNRLNILDSSLSVLNTSLVNFDSSLNELLTIGHDASFTNVDISGSLKLNDIDIADRLGNFDTSLSVLNTSLVNFDSSLNELLTIGHDASFTNVDISGSLKLNGIDVSGKLNNFDTSLSILNTSLGNFDTSLNELLTIGHDASFTNVDISGILKLNGTDISGKLNNFDSSLTNLLIKGNDASFGNIKVNRLEGPSNFIIDPATHGDDTGTVQIKGNLEVLGATTTINSNVLEISDNRILINSHSLLEGGIDISYSSDVSYHFLHIYNSNSWTTGDSSFITKNIHGDDAIFSNVFINSMDVSAKLNEHDSSLSTFNSRLSNINNYLDNSLNDLLTIGHDASFTNVDINGNFKLNGIDISYKLNNFDSSLTTFNSSLSNLDSSLTTFNSSLSNLDSSLNDLLTTNKDASFNNVDISGIFKLNGTDISNRLNNLDSSLSVLNSSLGNLDTSLGNLDTSLNDLLTTNKDASFNNVDISGTFKLNGTDISNRLNNFDSSLTTLDSKINNISTGNSDLSFNNIDISGTLTLSDVSNLGNMYINIDNNILNIDAKNVSYLTQYFSANTGGDISDISINNFLNNSQIIIYFKADSSSGNRIIGTDNSPSSNIKRNFASDISFNQNDEGLITITKIANTSFCSASIFK